MRILVTGGNGYIGRECVGLLLESNNDLSVVVRKTDNVDTIFYDKRVKLIESGDLSTKSIQWWVTTLKNIDAVLHLAWYAVPGLYHQSVENVNSLITTLNLGYAAKITGVKKFIGIGTCLEYAPSDVPLKVSDPVLPLTLYASTKLSAFQTLHHLFKASNTLFTWCRVFYLYGGQEKDQRLVPYIRRQIEEGTKIHIKSGHLVRDYIHVRAASKLIVELVTSDREGVINICSGEPVKIRDFVAEVAKSLKGEHLLNFESVATEDYDYPFIVGSKE